MEQKRLMNKFHWIPPEKRMGRFGPMPPRKPELRIPEYYLVTEGDETYFVNNTSEVVEEVIVDFGGFFTMDDAPVCLESTGAIHYPNVAPGEAVLVNVYDDLYDCDFVLVIDLLLHTSKYGRMRFQVDKKGGFDEHILLWNNGDLGKRPVRLLS